jgi:hypothetical protein
MRAAKAGCLESRAMKIVRDRKGEWIILTVGDGPRVCASGQWLLAEVKLEPMRARSERAMQDTERVLTGTGG